MAVPRSFNEDLAQFYVERVCVEADLVYRFAYALTLSHDAAFSCVAKTFESIVNELPNLTESHTVALRQVLFKKCWNIYKTLDPRKVSEEQAPITHYFKPLSADGRAAMFTVDLAGLSVGESAQVFGQDENNVRHWLAEARQRLVEKFR